MASLAARKSPIQRTDTTGSFTGYHQLPPTAVLSREQDTQLSLRGNPAPNRGMLPFDNMYDFNVDRFNPETPYFRRSMVDVNMIIRNTALQALSYGTQVA